MSPRSRLRATRYSQSAYPHLGHGGARSISGKSSSRTTSAAAVRIAPQIVLMAGIVLALLGCAQRPRVAAVVQAESLARHHSAVRAGPRFTWPNGAEVTVLGGHQQALWAPGEPHYSERAPEDEFQVTAEVVIPLR